MKKCIKVFSPRSKNIFSTIFLNQICFVFILFSYTNIYSQIPTTGSGSTTKPGPCPPAATRTGGYQSSEYANPSTEMYARITINSNSPVCDGNIINLSGASVAAVSYLWTGPGGFNSNSQNVFIPASPLTAGTYTLTAELTTGCVMSANTEVAVNNCNALTLNVKLLIEGYYLGPGQMQAVLFNQGISPDPTASDTVTVELHDALFPFATVASVKTILHTDGNAQAIFLPELISQSLYIVIRHRNIIETWSKFPVLMDVPVKSFDFSEY